MTVSVQTMRVIYTGNGATTNFPANFSALDDGDVEVYLYEIATEDMELLSGAVYNLNGVPGDTFSVDYPLVGSPIASTHKLIIQRVVELLQPSTFSNTVGFDPATLTLRLDEQVRMIQQVSDAASRSVKVDISGTTDPNDLRDDLLGSVAGAEAAAAAASSSASAAQTAENAAEAAQAAAEAAAASINPALFVEIADTSTADFGFVIEEDDMASNSATKVPTQQSVKAYVDTLEVIATGASEARSLQDRFATIVSVLDYGADPTGTTSSSAAFQAAIDDLEGTGGVLRIPSGRYYLATGVTMDLSGYNLPLETMSVSVQGDGHGNTAILVEAATTALTITNSNGRGRLKISGVQFQPKGATGTGVGLVLDGLPFCGYEDLMFIGLEYGLQATDIISSKFDRVYWQSNLYGFTIARVNQFRPNALTFVACSLNDNNEFGGKITGGGNFTWTGGSIENNGLTGDDTDRYGIKLEQMGVTSIAGALFDGCYFENNYNKADVWIDAGTDDCTYKFDGCSFHRINNTTYATNNILVDQGSGDGDIKLVLAGNGFKGWDTYVPNAARPYVKINAVEEVTVNSDIDAVNHWDSATEKPGFFPYFNDGLWHVLAQSSVAVSHTGDTNETVLATVAIPGGSIGPNGAIRVEALWSFTNNANAKTVRCRLGGAAGFAFLGAAGTSAAARRDLRTCHNVNAENSQKAFPAAAGTPVGVSTSAIATGAIDTSADQNLVFQVALATGTDTGTLEGYIVEIMRRL